MRVWSDARFARFFRGARSLVYQLVHRTSHAGEQTHRLILLATTMSDENETGVGPAPPETVALWVKMVASMGPDELADFERRTFAQWDRTSLGDLRRAIDRRLRELDS